MHYFRSPRASGNCAALAIAVFVALVSSASAAGPWWDKAWTSRQQVTINPAAEGVALGGGTQEAVVLVRLHSGNFQFASAMEDGSDLRVVSTDHKTPLPFHLEKYDGLLNEAFLWVKIPPLKPDAPFDFWVYYGNLQPPAEGGSDPGATYDGKTLAVFHFGTRNTATKDATKNANAAELSGVAAEGSLIGTGLRLDGIKGLVIPAKETLLWPANALFTLSFWTKPTAVTGKQILAQFGDAGASLRIVAENGVPFIEVTRDGAPVRSEGGTPLVEGAWQHLALVAEEGLLTLYVKGEKHSSLAEPSPALAGAFVVGGPVPDLGGDGTAFNAEIDEVMLTASASDAATIKLASVNQGASEAAGRLLVLGELDGGGGGHNATLEHVALFGDIARNMMFDGWISVGVCVLMMIFGWTVAVQKVAYLNSIQKGSEAFIKQWQHLSSDLTALDHVDGDSVKNFGGKVDPKTLRNIRRSPLYHLYHLGSEEIRNRIGAGKAPGLSARSIQAIRSSLDSGLVRENQRMSNGLIFLTISIAGGPYVGLLGTVVGVMITFALIAKTGEVEVNSIAPGIASALLATVFGLLVAIPALFIYSYLNSRIKELMASMHTFIDEFIAKMAEFYPEAGHVTKVVATQGGSKQEHKPATP